MTEIAIVGAGPYGLSIAAHLKGLGLPFRIFGRPMDSWRLHMPKGMLLKSDGFASNISDPAGEMSLAKFCASRAIAYSAKGTPVRLETFAEYGIAFGERMVPELEDRQVTGVEHTGDSFNLRLDDGERVSARRVVMAVGISHFKHMPELFTNLPPDLVSHSYEHHDLAPFKNRTVVVVGGGSSAIDLVALMQEQGIDVKLVARNSQLVFHDKHAAGKERSLWQRVRYPQSGLGPGIKSRLYCEFPQRFRLLPRQLRVDIVRTHLGPAGGWFAKDKVLGKVPLFLGHTPVHLDAKDRKAYLQLKTSEGADREIVADHIIVATGYKPDMSRLTFVSSDIRDKISTLGGAPVLSRTFESSIPGMYFVGLASAHSFGPLMRFAFGADFAARHLSSSLAKSVAKKKAMVPAAEAMGLAK